MSKIKFPTFGKPNKDAASRNEMRLLRRLELLKELQGRKMRTPEIAEMFDVDERTIREDLKALKTGMTHLGVRITLDSKSQGGREHSFKSTVHPVFLALNLTEVLALLNLLEDASDRELTGTIYNRLYRAVYFQLTQYAKDRLKGKLAKEYETDSMTNLLEEYAVETSWQHHLQYLIKSGRNVPVEFTGEDGVVRNVKIIAVRGSRVDRKSVV